MTLRPIHIILGLLTTWTAVSCDLMEHDDCPQSMGTKDFPVAISFTLAIENSSAVTRADDHTWNDNLDDTEDNDYESIGGTAFEYRINPDNVAVLIFNTDGTYAGQVTDLNYFQSTTQGTHSSDACEVLAYQFVGDITDLVNGLTAATEYKFMVLANCSIPQTLNATTIDAITYSMATDINYPNGYIPMWGVTSDILPYQESLDLGIIHLLRACAKVEVSLSDDLIGQGYTLKSNTLTRYNTVGYSLPGSWNTVTATTALTHAAGFRQYASAAENLSFSVENDYTCMAYVPEYLNIGTGATAATMDVVLTKDGTDYTFSGDKGIKFVEYSDGLPTTEAFNLMRNHYYKYTITQVKSGYQLALTCVVKDWNVEEEEWDYDDNVTVNEDGQLKPVEGTYQALDATTGEIAIKPGTDMQFNFQLDYPANGTWFATFVPISGTMTPFVFVDADGNEVATMSGPIGTSASLTLRPTETTIDENNYAYLRIIVRTIDGRSIVVHELLPQELREAGINEYTIVQSK